MNSYSDGVRRQCARDPSLAAAWKWQADYRSLHCTKCLGNLLDGDYFSEFVGELVDRYRELHLLEEMKGMITSLCGNPNSSRLTNLKIRLKSDRFKHIALPNGCMVELQLREAKWDFQIQRTPKLVLMLPRRCECKATGRRAAIDAFTAPTSSPIRSPTVRPLHRAQFSRKEAA